MSCGCKKYNTTVTYNKPRSQSDICEDYLNLKNLKLKISCEFLNLLSKIEKGYYPDYEFILEEISLVETYDEIDKKEFILQYYLNNSWETF